MPHKPIKEIFSVWEGVFKSFEEAGGDFSAFDTTNWLEKQKTKVLEQLKKLEDHFGGIPETFSKDYPLPLVVAMMLSQREEISILDFGGGMGLQYLELLEKVPASRDRVKFYVVDGNATLENRPKELEKFKNLTFCTSLEEVPLHCQIVHIGSTLQYVDKWQDLLKTIDDRFYPKYFVFSDLLAGDIPTFVTHQICYDKRIPNQLYNFNEFSIYLSKELGFNVIYITKLIYKILDQEVIYPNFALPKTHQFDRSINVVFYRP